MVSNRYESRSSRSIRICPTVAFQTFDYKLSILFYLSVGGETTEAEADGGVQLGWGEAEGAEDVRGFGEARGTGGAGGGGEVELEGG